MRITAIAAIATWAAIGLTLAAVLSVASAQTYPVKPVRLIVPFPPGGSNDTMTRTVGQKLGERWGQQVVIDNRPGAGGNVGSEIAARATPDGYTLLMGSSQLAVNPSLYSKLPFDAVKDFAPVSLVASTIYVLSLHPGVAAGSVKADRARESEARAAQLRLGRQRQPAAHGCRALQDHDRRADGSRPIQGRRARRRGGALG